jgi:cyclopropane fatty-acyl-phospholipid synthase-like methyltransferase
MAYRALELAPDARADERELLIGALDLEPGHDVLEVGSWDGYLAEKLGACDVKVTLLDRMPFGVQKLKKLYPRMRVYEGRQECMSVRDATFDRVAALVALHHIDVFAFMREANRVLRQGGRLALVEVGRGSAAATFLDKQVGAMRSSGHQGKYLSPGEWVAHLSAAGFSGVSVECRTVHWRFSTMSQAIEYCRCVFGLESGPEKIQAAIETLSPTVTDKDVVWKWPLIAVTGIRANDKKVARS